MHFSNNFTPHPTFSLEVVAPATTTERKQLNKKLANQLKAKPTFISLTAGSKTGQQQNSLLLSDFIQNDLQIPTMAHLTGLYHSKAEVQKILTELKVHHIKNLLILRGDRRENQIPIGDFPHASDLAQFVNQQGEFKLTGACYPEKHPESSDFAEELAHLKIKLSSGVEQLITQIVFDNQALYEFQDRLQDDKINIPVRVGIMPCINKDQLNWIKNMANVQIPAKLINLMEHYQNNPQAMQAAGVDYAINQIHELADHGVQGIHLYSMNDLENTNEVWNHTHNLFNTASNHELKRL